MKKLLSVLIISMMLFSLSACGSKKEADGKNASQTSEAVETETAKETETTKETETAAETETAEETKTADETKTVYWATKDKDSSDVAYHTKDCEIIKDKDPEELPWEIINTLGMPACEVCKP